MFFSMSLEFQPPFFHYHLFSICIMILFFICIHISPVVFVWPEFFSLGCTNITICVSLLQRYFEQHKWTIISEGISNHYHEILERFYGRLYLLWQYLPLHFARSLSSANAFSWSIIGTGQNCLRCQIGIVENWDALPFLGPTPLGHYV